EQVQRLAVDSLEKQRHREECEVEERAAGALRAEARQREPIEQDERTEAACERDNEPGNNVVAAERPAEAADHEWVERIEDRAAVSPVAVLCDADEPVGVGT